MYLNFNTNISSIFNGACCRINKTEFLWSTVLSDLLLAASSLFIALLLVRINVWPAMSFALIGFAATCGTARFAGFKKPTYLPFAHKYLFWAFNAIGIPMLTVGYLNKVGLKDFTTFFIVCAAMMIIIQFYSEENITQYITLSLDVCCVITCLFLCTFVKFSRLGILGFILFIIAGCFVKTTVYYGRIPGIDVFHYLLTVGNLSLFFSIWEFSAL